MYTFIYIYNINIYKPSVYVETESIKLKTYFLKVNFRYLHNFFIAYKTNC